jgi:hypothetical protein
VPESYGCSLLSLKEVEKRRKQGYKRELHNIMATALQWHCFVCCEGYGSTSLPERAWNVLTQSLSIKPANPRSEAVKEPGITDSPPEYVRLIFNK